MIHFSTISCSTLLDFLLSIFLHFFCFRNIYSSSSSRTHSLLICHILKTSITMLAPDSETEDVITVTSNLSKVHSLKATILQTMAFKLSLEINKNKMTPKSLIAFLKVLYNITQIKKKKITIEQYSRFHLSGPKIAICETASNVVFVLNSSFTTKNQYFRAAIQEAIAAFNIMLQDFGYTQKLEVYDPLMHQAHPPQQHPLFQYSLHIFTHLLSLFEYISHSFISS